MTLRTFTDRDEAFAFINSNIPWGSAAGTCKDASTAIGFAQAGFTVVTAGSFTGLQQDGNAGDNSFFTDRDSINAWGIPNAGFDAYFPELVRTRHEVNALGSEFWVSYSAGVKKFDPQEYHDAAQKLADTGAADVAEGNCSCGNMKLPSGLFKPVICYDYGLFDATVEALCTGAGKLKKAIKHTPTTRADVLIPNIESCLKHGVDYLIFSNTEPNCYLEKENGTPAIDMRHGGMGGKWLQPIVGSMLHTAAPMVKGTKLKLIAACGIDCGAEAYWALRQRAHGFVFNTVLSRNGNDPTHAQKIIYNDQIGGAKGLVDILVERGIEWEDSPKLAA